MISVTVNGEKRKVQRETVVADLLAELGIGGRRIAVERNREIIKREKYAETAIEDGDTFEIIEFVGGGF